MDQNIVYFDNAASSWPKPEGVAEAVKDVILHNGANPGRGSHRMAVESSRILYRTRAKIASLFGIYNPNDIVFTLNTTAALNLAILGTVKAGGHIVCTSIEHNSVRRPVEWLRRNRNVKVSYVDTCAQGKLNLEQLRESLESDTCLVIINHSSNLLGSITPMAEAASIVKNHGALLLVDAAQTAGVLPIHVQQMGIDLLAFPGHKALYGPQGTGGLYISPDVHVDPLVFGGTGSQSEAIEQPEVRPDRYESGTQNTPGIAGLGAGLDFVLNETPAMIHNKEWELTQRLMEGLLSVGGIHLLGPKIGEPRTGIVSFIMEGMDTSEAAYLLDHHFQIAVRSGYHCTPLAHQTAGTKESGAIRASLGAFTKVDDVDYLVDAVKRIRNLKR